MLAKVLYVSITNLTLRQAAVCALLPDAEKSIRGIVIVTYDRLEG